MPHFIVAELSTHDVIVHLRKTLPQHVFAPRPARLGWLSLHLSVVVGAWTWAVSGALGLVHMPVFVPPLLVVPVGMSMAGLAFVAHEVLHGSVVRGARLKWWIGQVAWAPFCLSADLWMAWHNRAHHPHTNVVSKDPDAYPDEGNYLSNRWARWSVELGAPGNHRFRGLITLLVGFSVQSLQVLLTARQKGLVTPRAQRKVWLHTAVLACFWLAMMFMVGLVTALCLYFLSLMIANAIVMAYIVTNHSLHRGVDADDPLATTLTVQAPRWYEVYSLQFGYHVEHHLFPTMSHVYGPLVQRELLRLAPERYAYMSLAEAWRRLHNTSRVRRDHVWLVDPCTGRMSRALGVPGVAMVTHPARGEPQGVANPGVGRPRWSSFPPPSSSNPAPPASERF